mmetsp:Transcript_10679/g.29667  ORF Transcript_10679/g.29667 Transcript_10679/m.29667 type:complete len:111 (+) Transcript_10679:113-445(+)
MSAAEVDESWPLTTCEPHAAARLLWNLSSRLRLRCTLMSIIEVVLGLGEAERAPFASSERLSSAASSVSLRGVVFKEVGRSSRGGGGGEIMFLGFPDPRAQSGKPMHSCR